MKQTETYQLNLIEGTDVFGYESINENTEIIDEKMKKLQEKVQDCFQSASKGKALVANAITGMGVSTTQDETFATMAEHISQIFTGTDVSDTTSSQEQVLAGEVFYDANGKRTLGTMTNRGSVRKKLEVNETYNIPAGYHNGEGTITQSIPTKGATNYTPSTSAQTIAAGQYLTGPQTIIGDGNLVSSNIAQGKSIFGISGSALIVVNPSPVTGLTCTVGFSTAGTVQLSWNIPNDGLTKGVRILYKTGSYPISYTDGSLFFDSDDTAIPSTYTKSGFVDGTQYYFTAFAYAYQNATRIYSIPTNSSKAYGTPLQVKGIVTFTSSGTFIVPPGVTNVDVCLVGGGGAGGASYNESGEYYNAGYAGGGGGAGYVKNYMKYTVTPGNVYPIVIGAGGIGIDKNTYLNKGNNGGTTYFDTLFASGGNGGGGEGSSCTDGGDGGSGGGSGAYGYSSISGGGSFAGTDGASDGGNAGGKGQGTTTRAFAESSNTLYAGGGAGGAIGTGFWEGGEGGGGCSASSATENTGGGGGGASGYSNSSVGNGASGIVIVRWGY